MTQKNFESAHDAICGCPAQMKRKQCVPALTRPVRRRQKKARREWIFKPNNEFGPVVAALAHAAGSWGGDVMRPRILSKPFKLVFQRRLRLQEPRHGNKQNEKKKICGVHRKAPPRHSRPQGPATKHSKRSYV